MWICGAGPGKTDRPRAGYRAGPGDLSSGECCCVGPGRRQSFLWALLSEKDLLFSHGTSTKGSLLASPQPSISGTCQVAEDDWCVKRMCLFWFGLPM